MPPISTVALLLAAALPQATPAPAHPTTTFHSDILRLDYTYPTSFTAQPVIADQALQSEKDKSSGATKAAANCVSLPLTATDTTNGFRMIIIMRLDGVCLGHLTSSSELGSLTTSSELGSLTTSSELGSLTTSALSQSLKRFGDPQMGTSADYQVVGHPAAVISGSVRSEQYHHTFYGTSTCLLQGADAVCWEFLASDCTRLPQLMANPIQFADQTPSALIPEQFAPPCKP